MKYSRIVDPIYHLEVGSIYRDDDTTRSIIDEDKKRAYDLAVADVREYATNIARLSSLSHNEQYAHLLKYNLLNWALLDSLTGSVDGTQFDNVLIPYNFAVLNLLRSGIPINGVGLWISEISNTIINYFNEDAGARTKINNHRYWAGLAVLTSGIVVESSHYTDWAHESYVLGIEQIQDDGTLPLELERGDKSFDYHNYAVQPLVAMHYLFYKCSVNDGCFYSISDRIKLLINYVINHDDFDNLPEHKRAWVHIIPDFMRTELIQEKINAIENPYFTGLGGDINLNYPRV